MSGVGAGWSDVKKVVESEAAGSSFIMNLDVLLTLKVTAVLISAQS